MLRPSILFPLFAEVSAVPGIGPKLLDLFKRSIGTRIIDVLFYLPIGLIDRRNMPPIFQMQTGDIVTTVIKVLDYREPALKNKQAKQPFKVLCSNETGQLNLIFFHAFPDYIKRQLPLNQMRVVSGKIERFGSQVQMIHPDYIVSVEGLDEVKTIEPVYALNSGLNQKIIRKVVEYALTRLENLPEWHDAQLIKQRKWPSWSEALVTLHKPTQNKDMIPYHPARMRMAYDELLASQLSLRMARKNIVQGAGETIIGNGILTHALRMTLPFSLTDGQENVLREITNDQQSNICMLRLLQGDVGSGKTVVALFAMLQAIEAGKQAALMVPTEVLARQHFEWIKRVTETLPIKIGFLGSSIKGKERKALLEELQEGTLQLIVGTHALFQEKVLFNSLGLAIIDEQHRFGVDQRIALSNKGKAVDTLLMTATPIPRTLTLAMYGDMECSFLKSKPAGRLPIDTRMVSIEKEREVMLGFERVLKKSERIYWICPLIEESEKLDLANAQERYTILNQIYPGKVGLVHGKMAVKERDETMLKFKEGTNTILVATTVVEVGVDVPEATVMVIEHAERFGLSQLHQLRGRVGRSSAKSSCILLYEKLNPIASERLRAIRNSNDGFFLAEEDLRLRGGGEILGTKQSGLPDFKFADLSVHHELLKMANKEAALITQQDPELTSRRGQALRLLLHLFGYDVQMGYLRAG